MKLSFSKLLTLGAALAAPMFVTGCDCNKQSGACTVSSPAVVSTSACSTGATATYAVGSAPASYSYTVAAPAKVVYPAYPSVAGVVYETASQPVVSAAAAEYVVESPVRVRPGRRYRRAHRLVAAEAPAAVASETVQVSAPAIQSVPSVSASAIYYTPGGTPVGAYVPGPAAAVAQRGPINNNVAQYYTSGQPVGASIHYTTGSKCNVQPQNGESVVWTSGF